MERQIVANVRIEMPYSTLVVEVSVYENEPGMDIYKFHLVRRQVLSGPSMRLHSYARMARPTPRHKYRMERCWGYRGYDRRRMPMMDEPPVLPDDVVSACRKALSDYFDGIAFDLDEENK